MAIVAEELAAWLAVVADTGLRARGASIISLPALVASQLTHAVRCRRRHELCDTTPFNKFNTVGKLHSATLMGAVQSANRRHGLTLIVMKHM